jgi:hypothetical protein
MLFLYWEIPQRLKHRCANLRHNCESGAEIHRYHEILTYINKWFFNTKTQLSMFIRVASVILTEKIYSIQRHRVHDLRCNRILNENSRVRRLLCRFLDVLTHLLVRNHTSVNLMLTVQIRIYDRTNRDHMIVLLMQTLEVWALWTLKVFLTFLSNMRVENFLDISFIQIFECFSWNSTA